MVTCVSLQPLPIMVVKHLTWSLASRVTSRQLQGFYNIVWQDRVISVALYI